LIRYQQSFDALEGHPEFSYGFFWWLVRVAGTIFRQVPEEEDGGGRDEYWNGGLWIGDCLFQVILESAEVG